MKKIWFVLISLPLILLITIHASLSRNNDAADIITIEKGEDIIESKKIFVSLEDAKKLKFSINSQFNDNGIWCYVKKDENEYTEFTLNDDGNAIDVFTEAEEEVSILYGDATMVNGAPNKWYVDTIVIHVVDIELDILELSRLTNSEEIDDPRKTGDEERAHNKILIWRDSLTIFRFRLENTKSGPVDYEIIPKRNVSLVTPNLKYGVTIQVNKSCVP